MRASLACTVLVAGLSLPALAVEGIDLSMKSRDVAGASRLPSKNAPAPFRHARDPMPELTMREEVRRSGPAGACEIAKSSVCYDPGSRKIVYRGARQYMPKVDGLRPESVSLRRWRITLRYSF